MRGSSPRMTAGLLLDLVDAPQVRIDPRLPAGSACLVGLDHLTGQPQRYQLLGRRLVGAAALADRGGEFGENFGERFCLRKVFRSPFRIVPHFAQGASAVALSVSSVWHGAAFLFYWRDAS